MMEEVLGLVIYFGQDRMDKIEIIKSGVGE